MTELPIDPVFKSMLLEERRQGRREVVEFIKDKHLLYDPDYDDMELWKKQLKEWGLAQCLKKT